MIEQHVTNLEISKRLKELGVKQESFYYWDKSMSVAFPEPWVVAEEDSGMGNSRICSAFLTSELGELLPWLIEKDGHSFELEMMKNGTDKPYEIYYQNHEKEMRELLLTIICQDENEANCRGKMLIYLLENKIITL